MNQNKLEDKAEDIQTANDENADSDNISSQSSNFKDLYDDLLNTLNTSTNKKTPKQTDSADIPEKSRQTTGSDDKAARTNKTNQEPAKRTNNNLNELLEMIDLRTEGIKKSPPVSENSFKDNIVNGEIFDSVLEDLNKQKVERSEKKKERHTKSYSTNATSFTDDAGTEEISDIHEDLETSKKESPAVKEYVKQTNETPKYDIHETITPKVKDYIPFENGMSEEDDNDKPERKKTQKNNSAKTLDFSDSSFDDLDDLDATESLKPYKENESEIKQNKTATKRSSKSSGNKARSKSEERDVNLHPNENENDDELLKAFGFNYKEAEKTKRVSGNAENMSQRAKISKSKSKLKAMHQLINGEYVSYEQNADIFAGYKKIFTAEWIKLAISVVCLIILLYMEIAPQFKLPLPYFLDTKFYNAIYILVDLQILLIVAWLNHDSLIFGIKSIFASVVNIYYISIFFVISTFIHTLFTYILRYNNPDMVLFNSVTVLGLILVGLYNLLDINIEIMGFKVVSSKKPKYSVYLNNNSILEMEEFRDIIPENTVVGNIFKSNFSSNFFSRINRKKINGSYEKHFLVISASVAVLIFALLLGFKIDKYTALSSAVSVLLCSIPLCSLIVNIVPLYKAQKTAYTMASAVIGAESVNEHSEISIISVNDRDIFPPEHVKISGVRVYGNNNRLETVLQYFCAVFEKLNFALVESFKSSTTYEDNFDRNVDIISIAENGICFVSNGRKLFMGNREYISNIGLSVSYDQNFDEQFLKSSGSILFLSSDREVISKICIKYEIVPEFFDILKNLNKSNVCLGIRTFDPSIDDELIRKLANFKKFPVKVIKLKNPGDVYIMPESMESGIVSKASLKSFIKTLLLCNKTKSVIKSNILIQTIAFIAGVGFTTIVTVLGIAHSEIWTINSLYILLFHIFWMVPIMFLSGLTPN